LTANPSKLLVVDDDASNRVTFSRSLVRRGYSVEVAESGPEALEKIEAAHYDLVLLDQICRWSRRVSRLSYCAAGSTARESWWIR
jgi:DNA-binding NtrC family response regulator